MGDSYLLQASYWSVIVELCSDWRNDKEIIFFGPSVFTLRKNPSLFSCIWFFFFSLTLLTLFQMHRWIDETPEFAHCFSIVYWTRIKSFYSRVNFNRFPSLLCFLSIYFIFFSPFPIVKFQHRRLLLAFHRQRVVSIVDVISLPLDSIQATAVMRIRWRPRCANTSKDQIFCSPTKTKNSNRSGCAELAAVSEMNLDRYSRVQKYYLYFHWNFARRRIHFLSAARIFSINKNLTAFFALIRIPRWREIDRHTCCG